MHLKGSIKTARSKPSEATVISPLPLDDYTRRLREQIDPWWKVFGSRPLIGRLKGNRLKVRKRIGYGNSFQTRLKADLSKYPGGTRIACRFGTHPFATGFLMVWLIAVAAFFLAALGHVLTLGEVGDRLPFLIVPLFMLGVGAVMYPIGRRLARNEQGEILQILKDI